MRDGYRLPDGRVVSWVALVRLLLALEPTRCPDLATVDALFGDAKFKTLAEVSEAMSVHPGTVRADWRAAGLPGDAETGWPIGEVFRWHVGRIERRESEN